jgi:hypothetical protein
MFYKITQKCFKGLYEPDPRRTSLFINSLDVHCILSLSLSVLPSFLSQLVLSFDGTTELSLKWS